MGKCLRVQYDFDGHDHFVWQEGKARVEGALFLVGAIRFDGGRYAPASERRCDWAKICVLKGLCKGMLDRREGEELRFKKELPRASPASLNQR